MFNPILPGLFWSFWAWGAGRGTQISKSIKALAMKLGMFVARHKLNRLGLSCVNYDMSWRHNNITKLPFWIWGRHLESQTCSHTADNDITKKYDFVLRNILSQNKHTKVKNCLLLTNEGEKTEKKTENSQKTLLSRRLLWKRQSS